MRTLEIPKMKLLSNLGTPIFDVPLQTVEEVSSVNSIEEKQHVSVGIVYYHLSLYH